MRSCGDCGDPSTCWHSRRPPPAAGRRQGFLLGQTGTRLWPVKATIRSLIPRLVHRTVHLASIVEAVAACLAPGASWVKWPVMRISMTSGGTSGLHQKPWSTAERLCRFAGCCIEVVKKEGVHNVHTSGFEFGWTGLGRGCIGEVFGGVADSQGEEPGSSPISWASECAQIVLLGPLRGPYVLLVAFGAAGSSSHENSMPRRVVTSSLSLAE